MFGVLINLSALACCLVSAGMLFFLPPRPTSFAAVGAALAFSLCLGRVGQLTWELDRQRRA